MGGESHSLKYAFIQSLQKSGVENEERVMGFLTSFRTLQSDPSILRKIDSMIDNLPQLLAQHEFKPKKIFSFKDRVEELNTKINTSWYQCLEKIWKPSLSHSPQAIFRDDQSGDSFLVNENGASLVSLPNNLDYDYKFRMSYLGSRPVIAIGLRRTLRLDPYYKGSYGLYLAFHEGFHHIFQSRENGWARDKSFQRGDRYPDNWRPRYYRRMLYESLKKAFLGNNSNSLGQATFWYNKWKKEFPGEVPQSVDRQEGVATYYDVMSVVNSILGCRATRIEMFAFIRKNFNMFIETPSDFNSEGYNIGGLSGILMWNPEQLDWQDRVVAGESPVEILLSSSQEIHDQDNISIRNEIQGTVEKKNSKTKEQLDGVLDNFHSKEFVRIVIPGHFDNKSMPVANMVIPMSLPGTQIYVVGKGYLSETQTGDFLRAEGLLSLIEGLSNPCGKNGKSFVVPRSIVQSKGGHFEGQSSSISFKVKGNIVESEGKTWLCAN